MPPLLPLAILAGLAALAWRAWRLQPGEGAPLALDFTPLDSAAVGADPAADPTSSAPVPAVDVGSFWRGLDSTDSPGGELMPWKLPAGAAPYAEQISKTETAQGIPAGLLARLLHQESRYRQDIISGATRSPAGALGIAQFMPRTAAELGIDPLNPNQAIPAAGLYLRRLYDQTGSWASALAAYNWGIGNVKRKGLDKAPAETRAYVAQISNDVGLG